MTILICIAIALFLIAGSLCYIVYFLITIRREAWIIDAQQDRGYDLVMSEIRLLVQKIDSLGDRTKVDLEHLSRHVYNCSEAVRVPVKEVRDVVRDRYATLLFEIKKFSGHTMISDSWPDLIKAFLPLAQVFAERQASPPVSDPDGDSPVNNL